MLIVVNFLLIVKNFHLPKSVLALLSKPVLPTVNEIRQTGTIEIYVIEVTVRPLYYPVLCPKMSLLANCPNPKLLTFRV